jgi:hypothetical protein
MKIEAKMSTVKHWWGYSSSLFHMSLIILWITFVLKSAIIRDIVPCGLWKSTDVQEEHIASNFRVEEYAKQETSMKSGGKQSHFHTVSCLAYSSTLKMEATYSFEMSVDFQWTTLHYIPEDSTIHNYCCENLRSYILFLTVFIQISLIAINSCMED